MSVKKYQLLFAVAISLISCMLSAGILSMDPSIFYHQYWYVSGKILQDSASFVLNVPLDYPLLPTEMVLSLAGVEKRDWDLLKAMMFVESSFNAYAVSKYGAVGLLQLMPKTAEVLGVTNRFDPFQNVRGAYKYLKALERKFGSESKAIAAYHHGPGNVARYGIAGPGKVYLEKVRAAERRIINNTLDTSFIKERAWLFMGVDLRKSDKSYITYGILSHILGSLILGVKAKVEYLTQDMSFGTYQLVPVAGYRFSERFSVLGGLDLVSGEGAVLSFLNLGLLELEGGWDQGLVVMGRTAVGNLLLELGYANENFNGIITLILGGFKVGLGWNGEFFLTLES